MNDQVSVVSPVPAIWRICVNKTNRNKTLHLPVEINRYVVEGLVDTGASMSVMAVVIVRKLGMMHLIAGSETYKTASGIVTQALSVATPLWPSVGVKPNTCKVGDLESSGTPECSELDNKAQTTSPWGVLEVIRKVLKRRYRKWPRIGHLDICSPSYGQKKGRESNW
jgi:hypothetical protein